MQIHLQRQRCNLKWKPNSNNCAGSVEIISMELPAATAAAAAIWTHAQDARPVVACNKRLVPCATPRGKARGRVSLSLSLRFGYSNELNCKPKGCVIQVFHFTLVYKLMKGFWHLAGSHMLTHRLNTCCRIFPLPCPGQSNKWSCFFFFGCQFEKEVDTAKRAFTISSCVGKRISCNYNSSSRQRN